MSAVAVIAGADFLAAAGGFVATAAAPVTGRVVVRAEGLATRERATLAVAGDAPLAFADLAGVAFAATPARAGARVVVTLPERPLRCVVSGIAEEGPSAILAGVWPEAIARPVVANPPDLAAAVARVEAALARFDLDAALAVLAEMLLAARGAPQTQAAAAAILEFLGRHPLCRSPRLGAMAAALTEQSAWP